MEDVSKVFRIRPSKNRSEFPALMAYKTVYGTEKGFIEDRIYTRERRAYKGEIIDANLQDEWIDNLYKITRIDMRHFSQGKSPKALTYVIFRPHDQNPQTLAKIVKKLTKGTTKAQLFPGNGGKQLVCVAVKNWYRSVGSNINWEKWWKTIDTRINSAVNK